MITRKHEIQFLVGQNVLIVSKNTKHGRVDERPEDYHDRSTIYKIDIESNRANCGWFLPAPGHECDD